jgi:cyanophycinase
LIKHIWFSVFFISLISVAYAQELVTKEKILSQVFQNRPASLGIIGDTTDVKTDVTPGIVLMGGGGDVDAAIKWMIERSGGGNVIIIASGTDAYNSYMYKLGRVASVETLKIDNRKLAENEEVARIIRNAEMLFIAGGDQSVYMKSWKGTKTNDAINYLLQIKKVPVGGTSAGCAILGSIYYSGEGSSAVSKEVLMNPFHKNVTVYQNDFLKAPFLHNVITDQHYVARNRQGRHVVFMSRIINDWNIHPKGIAVDERTAVCIDEKGMAKVFGKSKAYFIHTKRSKSPEKTEMGEPLQWKKNNKALKVYEIQGTESGNGKFYLKKFKPKKGASYNKQWWWVENGELKTNLQT